MSNSGSEEKVVEDKPVAVDPHKNLGILKNEGTIAASCLPVRTRGLRAAFTTRNELAKCNFSKSNQIKSRKLW